MNARIYAWSVVAVLVLMGTGCGRVRARKAAEAETPAKAGTTRGVAVKIEERVDKAPVAASTAEAEIIAGLRAAGIEVVVKGTPEFAVSGTVEANLGGRKELYGVSTVAYDAVAALKVTSAKDGVVLETVSTRARKVGPSAESASRDAIKEAGAEAAKRIAAVLKKQTKSAK